MTNEYILSVRLIIDDNVELNEAQLIERELTVRSLRLSKEAKETRRAAIRWLALSIGVINPGESRLSAISVLDALVFFQFINNTDPDVNEMIGYISSKWEPINEKTLRYHLLRMKKMGIVENNQGKFFFRPPNSGDRFDAHVWASSLFSTFYGDVASKIGELINDLKTKNTTV